MSDEIGIKTRGPAPQVRIGFQVPASEFRMHCTEESKPALYNRCDDHFKIWTYEVIISVGEHREYTDIPAGIWTFSVQRTTKRNSPNPTCKKYSDERVEVFVTPSAAVLSDHQEKDLNLDYFVGFGGETHKSSKGKGALQNGDWQCCPAFLSTVYGARLFSYDNSIIKGNMWSLDLYFHVEFPGKNTVERFNGLVDSLAGVFKSGQFSDFQLVSAEGKTFPVHRVILASHSPFFAAMLSHNIMLENTTGVYNNPAITSDILEIVLDFLYGRTVSDALENKVEEVLAVAHKLQMRDLLNVCEGLMVAGLNGENALHHLGIAVKYGLDKLMKKAAKFVAE